VDGAVAVLTEVPGIGPWTAEMFLIFGLKRSNVLSVGDAGLRRATRLLYGTDDMHACAQPWHPYCSVACWYLWRHLDNDVKV
jgi:DNA-3-methyladenine glycosylase II